eukprot:1947708-Rhodomonas_salina.1
MSCWTKRRGLKFQPTSKLSISLVRYTITVPGPRVTRVPAYPGAEDRRRVGPINPEFQHHVCVVVGGTR